LGREDDALRAAKRALELARKHGERANEAYALRTLGEVDLQRRNLSDAKTWLIASLAIAQELGMRPLEANCHRGLANGLDLGHQTSDAEHHRDISNSLARAMEMRFWG